LDREPTAEEIAIAFKEGLKHSKLTKDMIEKASE
jgi:hypothetical protein